MPFFSLANVQGVVEQAQVSMTFKQLFEGAFSTSIYVLAVGAGNEGFLSMCAQFHIESGVHTALASDDNDEKNALLSI